MVSGKEFTANNWLLWFSGYKYEEHKQTTPLLLRLWCYNRANLAFLYTVSYCAFNLLTWRHRRTEKSLCSLWFLNHPSLHHKKGKWRDCLGISKLFWEKIITVVYPESVRYSIICNFLHSHDILEHKILSCNAFSVLISVNALNELIYNVRMTWSSALVHLLRIFNLSKNVLSKKILRSAQNYCGSFSSLMDILFKFAVSLRRI